MRIPQSRPLDTLNAYLLSRDVSPIRSQLQTSWENASARTKRYYTRKAGQGVAAVVKDITPHETGPLFHALCSSDALRRQLSGDEDSDEDTVDATLMTALAECYQAANRWETRRQILSIMADKLRYNKLLRYIPGLDQIPLYRSQTPLLGLRKRRTGTVRKSSQDRCRLPADRAFHCVYNKLAHCSRSAIWRKIHNA